MRQFYYETRKPSWFSPVTLAFIFVALLFLLAGYLFRAESAEYRELKESNLEFYEKWSSGEQSFLFGGYAQEFKRMADDNERQEEKFSFLAVAAAVGAGVVFLGSFSPLIRYAVIKKFGMKYSATVEQDSSETGMMPYRNRGMEMPVTLRTYIRGKDVVIFAARRKSRSSPVREVGRTTEVSKLGKYIVVCD